MDGHGCRQQRAARVAIEEAALKKGTTVMSTEMTMTERGYNKGTLFSVRNRVFGWPMAILKLPTRVVGQRWRKTVGLVQSSTIRHHSPKLRELTHASVSKLDKVKKRLKWTDRTLRPGYRPCPLHLLS